MEKANLKALGDHSVEAILADTRPSNAITVDADLIDDSPIIESNRKLLEHPFDQLIYEKANDASILEGKIIAFDLDDTLLNTNYICKQTWSDHDPMDAAPGTLSIKYHKLQKPLAYWLKAGWKKTIRQQFDSNQYPFLKNPDVIAQFRPGALAMLLGLREAGAKLLLITMSDVQRVRFLFNRFPILEEYFGSIKSPTVITANDLAHATHELNQYREARNQLTELQDNSLNLHFTPDGTRVYKTPFLIEQITQGLNYNLLVDDSLQTTKMFALHNLSQKIIQVDPFYPHGTYTYDILQAIEDRLTETILAPGKSPLPKQKHPFNIPSDYPFIRFEDPLYFPLIHQSEIVIPYSIN